MNNLEKAKEIIKTHYNFAQHGIFNCRNLVGDVMETIYEGDGLMIDVCYNQSYFEVFGLTDEDFKELKTYYQSLRKKIKNTEKIKVMIDIDEDYKSAYQQGYSDAMRDLETMLTKIVNDTIKSESEE